MTSDVFKLLRVLHDMKQEFFRVDKRLTFSNHKQKHQLYTNSKFALIQRQEITKRQLIADERMPYGFFKKTIPIGN